MASASTSGGQPSEDFEAIVLKRMRQAQERKMLNQELAAEDGHEK